MKSGAEFCSCLRITITGHWVYLCIFESSVCGSNSSYLGQNEKCVCKQIVFTVAFKAPLKASAVLDIRLEEGSALLC